MKKSNFKKRPKKQSDTVERKLVDKLASMIDDIPVASVVDKDSKDRAFVSGFDIAFYYNNRCMIVEAKRTVHTTKELYVDKNENRAWELLRDSQADMCDTLNASGTSYWVCHFRELRKEIKVDLYEITSRKVNKSEYRRHIEKHFDRASMGTIAGFIAHELQS